VDTGDGLTDVMVGRGMSVSSAVPLDVGDAVLAARTVTMLGEGTVAGAR
jgi:hypothetical protein